MKQSTSTYPLRGCVGGDPVGVVHAKGPTHGGGAQAALGSSGGVDYAEQQGAQAAVLGGLAISDVVVQSNEVKVILIRVVSEVEGHREAVHVLYHHGDVAKGAAVVTVTGLYVDVVYAVVGLGRLVGDVACAGTVVDQAVGRDCCNAGAIEGQGAIFNVRELCRDVQSCVCGLVLEDVHDSGGEGGEVVEELHTDVDGGCLALGDINTVVVTSLHHKGDWLTGGGGEVVEWRGVQEHCPRVRYVSN